MWTSDRLWHLEDAVKQIQAASSSVSLLCHGRQPTCLNPARNGTSIQANGLYSRGAVRQLWLWGLNEMITLDSRWFVSCMCRTSRTNKMCSIFSMRYISVCLDVYGRQLFLACKMQKAWNPNECTNNVQTEATNKCINTVSKGLRQPACDTQQEWGFCVILPLYAHGKTTVSEFSVKGAWSPGVHAQKPSPRWNNVKQGCLTSLDLSHSCCNL